MAEKFRINEYGEIIREDYFFRQVQNNQVQFLPFERKVWKIYLLSLFNIGYIWHSRSMGYGKGNKYILC